MNKLLNNSINVTTNVCKKGSIIKASLNERRAKIAIGTKQRISFPFRSLGGKAGRQAGSVFAYTNER